MNPATALGVQEMMIRIGCSMAAGLILGLERESHGRAAGLKTTILACVASCIAMILSENFFLETADTVGVFRPDRARLAAGILTGIGFLGAGAIIRQGTLVRGVTTAAVLWFITILGLSFGSGHLVLGGIGTGIAIFALFALPHVEQLIKKDIYASLTVTMGLEGAGEEELRNSLERFGVRVQRLNLEYDIRNASRTLLFGLKLRKGNVFAISRQVVESMAANPGVSSVKWD